MNFSVIFKQLLYFLVGDVLNREKIWQQYFAVRSSSIFISQWTAFLEQASVNPTPTLYQLLTDIIFRDLNFVIPSQQSSITEDVSVLEGNALP